MPNLEEAAHHNGAEHLAVGVHRVDAIGRHRGDRVLEDGEETEGGSDDRKHARANDELSARCAEAQVCTFFYLCKSLEEAWLERRKRTRFRLLGQESSTEQLHGPTGMGIWMQFMMVQRPEMMSEAAMAYCCSLTSVKATLNFITTKGGTMRPGRVKCKVKRRWWSGETLDVQFNLLAVISSGCCSAVRTNNCDFPDSKYYERVAYQRNRLKKKCYFFTITHFWQFGFLFRRQARASKA